MIGLIMLADTLDRFSPGAIGWTVLGLIGALSVVALALLVFNQSRTAFGRQPTVNDEFKTQQKTLEELRESLAGLAPTEKVNELVNKLSTFATQDQIREIERQLPELIKREELERTIEKLEVDLNAQWKEMRTYVHTEVHDLRGVLSGMDGASHLYRDGIHSRLGAITEVLFDLRGQMRGSFEREERRHPTL